MQADPVEGWRVRRPGQGRDEVAGLGLVCVGLAVGPDEAGRLREEKGWGTGAQSMLALVRK